MGPGVKPLWIQDFDNRFGDRFDGERCSTPLQGWSARRVRIYAHSSSIMLASAAVSLPETLLEVADVEGGLVGGGVEGRGGREILFAF